MRHLFMEQRESCESVVCNTPCMRNSLNPSKYSNSSGLRGKIDIGELIRMNERNGKLYYSFELVSRVGDEDIYESFFKNSIKSPSEFSPLFYALTCHVKCFSAPLLPLQFLPEFPKNTLLHLSCRGLKCADADKILEEVLNLGITNLLIIRGDNPLDDGDFMYAIDLIKYIKTRYDSKFSIAVAGYPDTHPESQSKESDLYYLKKKVDAGASFIISQIIFESQSFIKFVNACRAIGIDVPIIPGIFPIINYKSLMNLAGICSLKVPERVHKDLKEIRDDDEKIQAYGRNLATKITKEIIESGVVHGFHLFTLNKISITAEIISAITSSPTNK